VDELPQPVIYPPRAPQSVAAGIKITW